MSEDKKIVYETVTEADKLRPVTMAELKVWKNRTLNDLNCILQGFQEEQVRGQARLNLIWNSINAIIRAFTKKQMLVGHKDLQGLRTEPLLSENDILEAGEELMKEARANMEAAKKAADEKRRVASFELVKTPLEDMQHTLSRIKVEDKS